MPNIIRIHNDNLLFAIMNTYIPIILILTMAVLYRVPAGDFIGAKDRY